MSNYEIFESLHPGPSPFILGIWWYVESARLLETAGYPAIGFSSHAISTSFGYEDGEQLPFELLLRTTRKVVAMIKAPFTVDMEGGFSRNTAEIIANIDRLIDAGVAGINLEDTVAGPTRHIQPAATFAAVIEAIANHLSRTGRKLFLNIRTDGFLLNMPTALPETVARATIFANAGASGLFVPCISNPADIEQVVGATALPVNVMVIPGLPDYDVLGRLGVKRISMGPFLFSKVYSHAARLAQQVQEQNNFQLLL
jgi:2-methylisocitrate lyase-like PEP mutase family enzyme